MSSSPRDNADDAPLPPVCIVTAVRNGADWIGHCVDTVRRQTVAARHIVVDGMSADRTPALLRERAHPGLRVIREPDHGMYDAMNKGIALAECEVVGILNADDYYPHAGVLERIARAFSDERVDACYGDLLVVEAGGGALSAAGDSGGADPFELPGERPIRFWRAGTHSPRSFYWGWMPPHPTFFVRRNIYARCGGFRLDLGSSADYELMLRLLLKHRIRCRYVPEVLVKMRTGGVSSSSLRNRIAANLMDRRAWRVNGIAPHPWTLLLKPVRKLHQWHRPSQGCEAGPR